MGQNLGQGSQRIGIARMDEFESAASWDLGGGDSLVLKFDDEQLSVEQRAQLKRFRAGIPTIELQLGGSEKRKANIVGHSARDNTFYLTWL